MDSAVKSELQHLKSEEEETEMQELARENSEREESQFPVDEKTAKGDQEHVIAIDVGEDAVRKAEEAQQTSLYFSDGQRKIDFVLVYTESSTKSKDTEPSPLKDAEPTKRKDYFRKEFEKNLTREGLELEHEKRQVGKVVQVYVKIHAPWDVLTRVAELIPLKMPIKECDIEPKKHQWCLGSCANPLALDPKIVKKPTMYFSADFSRERQDMFVINSRETFFSNAQRSLIVHELLLRTSYLQEDPCKFGVDKLIKLGVYTSAFPLHDGYYWSHCPIETHEPINDRHLLYEMWAAPSKWYKLQPLDLIRKYYGEKIAIYFAWLGYYTYMLFLAGLIGVLVFLFGLITVWFNTPSEEICDQKGPGQFVMCPLCDRNCSYWYLYISCGYARLTYVFDNYATVFFAGFMAVWSTAFLDFWKRQEAVYQYNWDMTNFDKEERIRPEYEVKVKDRKKNPVTQVEEPYLPWTKKIPRQFTSVSVVLFMVCSVVAALFGVIMYRIIVLSILYVAPDDLLRTNAKIITTISSGILCLIAITFLNILYQKIAIWLTDLEYRRTDSEYEDSFIFKMFVFQFINYYASIFYIAFFKGRIGGRPGNYDYRLGYRAEECDPGGCLIELCIQLAIVMVGKQALNNFQELMWPKIINWYKSGKIGNWFCKTKSQRRASNKSRLPQCELDSELLDYPPMGLFEDYLEMVIQYGFITIFVAAFPLAPLFALFNNVIEIRVDAYKLVTQWKRPIPSKAQDIGIWFGILRGITYIGIITNGFIIGWTSDFVPKMVYKFAVSRDGSLAGYVNNSLSYFNVSDFQEQSIPAENFIEGHGAVNICRFADYREGPWSEDKYEFTSMYWHVFCARLAFVILFEHLVLFLTWFVSYLIPPVPADIQLLVLREMYIAKEARYSVAFSTLHDERDEVRQRQSAAGKRTSQLSSNVLSDGRQE